MADSFVRVPADSVGKKVDATSLDVGADTVYRQRVVIGDNSATAQFATVTGGALVCTGTFNISAMPQVNIGNISATVAVSGAFTLTTLDSISATVTVAGSVNISTMPAVVLAAGAANIGSLNHISRTVTVVGVVSIAAGTALIGDVNAISRTVQVAIGTPFTVNNISAAVTVTGRVAVENISATVVVAGAVALTAGTAVIGDINAISRTVQVAIGTPFTIQAISTTVTVAGSVNISATATAIVNGPILPGASVTAGNAPVLIGGAGKRSVSATAVAVVAWFAPDGSQVVVNNRVPAYASASRGPKCVTCSTSAGVALIAAPGAGLCVYIVGLECTNGSSTLTRADVFQASATASCMAQMYMAASGGGFVKKYDPPVKCLSNTGVTCRVKPSVSQAIYNVHFYVAPK